MNKFFTLSAFLIATFAFGQEQTIDNIAIAERSTASKTIAFKVNPNTTNYDITYHKLEFTVDPAVSFISGKVTTTYTALSDMATITFDFANELTVSAVTSNGSSLTFVENANNELVINLPAMQNTGVSATIEITYSGTPPVNGSDSFVVSSHGSPAKPLLYTLSEPFGARDWWPCKQDLNDKIDAIDVYVTAPSSYVSVSNGIEPEAPVINGANKTTHFQHNYPIPAYLIALAVTNYTVYNQTTGTTPNQFPIVNYIYPESLSSVQTQLDQTPPIMDFFNSKFEIYPFYKEKYGHAQCSFGGGMEHTTVSFMGSFGRALIAHELAHHWFGNKITCGSWNDIWLNEGFATYLASLVIENFDGQAAFITDKANMISAITATPGGAVYLTDTEALSINRIFSSQLSYKKGAMVLHMLRFKLGDALFFQGLKNYLSDANLAFKYATTPDLQTHLEAVYGSSLSEFFNDWIYNQGYPTYSVNVQNVASGQAKITVNQTTSHASVSFFEMPVPIRLLGAGGLTHDVVVDNTVNGEQFTVAVPFVVTGILFDPTKELISRNNTATLDAVAFELDPVIAITPNPVVSELVINLPQSLQFKKLTIYNELGQKVLESQTEKATVTALSTGIYTVAVETSAGVFHKKVIKK
jgi:aminopeptidase N